MRKSGHTAGQTRMQQPPLLDPEAPRSDYVKPAAITNLAMDPVTGTFADPSHETAFGAQLFRLAFPAHVLLMAFTVGIGYMIWCAIPSVDVLVLSGVVFLLILTFGLVGRVLLHLLHEPVRGQRLGSRVWTAGTVLINLACASGYAANPATACQPVKEDYLSALFLLATALVNGSHGMGFVHKLALMVPMLICELFVLALCGILPRSIEGMEVGALGVGTAVAHMAELKMRQLYVERRQLEETRKIWDEDRRRLEQRNEQLRQEKERLDYERHFALHQVAGLQRSDKGARERATSIGPPSLDILTSGCGTELAATPAATAPPPTGGGRHVACTQPTQPADVSNSQYARGGAVVGTLREARVTAEWPGADSTGGNSASTELEIVRILSTNASLGARMPRPVSPCSPEPSPGMADAELPPRAAWSGRSAVAQPSASAGDEQRRTCAVSSASSSSSAAGHSCDEPCVTVYIAASKH